MIEPMVWSVAERPGFITDVQAMRRRVIDHIPAHEAERQLKLGSGGLRDVEFAVQLLQLVHGRADPTLREGATLSALTRLTEGGYVGREDGEKLHEAYAFLRTLEHRIQLHQLRRTHVVPEDEASLRRLGRSIGLFSEPAVQLDKQWRYHRREVRRLHEKLFYRPLLGAVARLPGTEARLSLEAAETRLAALGYADPKAALRHLEALTSGVSRTSDIQRTLLPVLLEWFADSPDPDAGLFGFRRISESLGRSPWYLTMLRDEGEVAQRLAHVLGTSRYATDLLEREPQGVKMLGESLVPLSAEAALAEMKALVDRAETAESAAVRGAGRTSSRAAADRVRRAGGGHRRGGGRAGPEPAHRRDPAGDAGHRHRVGAPPAVAWRRHPRRIAVIAMGRYGGFELSYGSDADVMFVHEPVEGRRGAGRRVVRHRRGQRGAAAAVAAGERPAAGGRRRPAPRGQERPDGAHARVLRRLLREVVARVGVPGAAACRSRRRRRGAAAAVHRAHRPAALPGRGDLGARRGGGAPDQGARGQRAAPARSRPADPPQAGSRGAGRRRVDRPAPPDAPRRRPTRGCGRRRPCRRWRRPSRPTSSRPPTPGRWPRRGAW